MFLTEDEAKKKWCPMVRTSGLICGEHGGVTVNDPSGNYDTTCKGSDCMMWRWAIPPPHITQDDEGKNITDKTGYCGLGGKS